jgi:hypothetical protein
MKTRILLLVTAISLLTVNANLRAQGTAFMYQGQLENNGSPANGTFNLTFTLFNTTNIGVTAVAGPVALNDINVANGLFTVLIDFGPGVFTGQTSWLEIGVEASGASSFTTLAPRQELTPAPGAIFASTAGNLSGTLPTSQLSGTVGNSQLADSSITVTAGTGLSGGGTVPLGGSITLNASASASGVLSVTGNADITATTVSGDVTLGDTATTNDTPNLIVKRDATGSFSADYVSLDGGLVFPASTTGPDIMFAGNDLLFYGDDNGNFFSGENAGGSTTTGVLNTGVVYGALASNEGGSNNVATGYGALYSMTSGYDNTGFGFASLYLNTTGLFNTAIGYEALFANSTGRNNTAIGDLALSDDTTPYFNTAVGVLALGHSLAGSNNIAVGAEAGLNFASDESANIDIGNPGTAGESGVTRIGVDSVQKKCYLAGTVYANGVALTSDRNAKTNFKPVDFQAVLAKVVSLPVSQWNYKTDSDAVEHIGPMAQDFQAAFQLSDDDTHISVVDEGGVALAAIHGLNQKLDEKDAEIEMLKAKASQVDSLESRLAELERLVQSLTQKK